MRREIVEALMRDAERRAAAHERNERNDGNELEPIYRAQDAAFEERYGPRDDGYDD